MKSGNMRSGKIKSDGNDVAIKRLTKITGKDFVHIQNEVCKNTAGGMS